MKKNHYPKANEPDLPEEVIREIKLWEKKNSRPVLNHPGARQALAKLFREGCYLLEILDHLEHYCQCPLGPIKEELGYGRQARKLSKHLVNDFEELRLLKIPVTQSCLDEGAQISELLLDFWRESKTALTPRGAQAVFLVAAAKFIKAATGKEHYPEIEMVIHALRPGKKLDPNTISKNVINFDARGEVPYMDDSDIKYLANRLKKKQSHLRKKNPKR
jgi:hypothetical protein